MSNSTRGHGKWGLGANSWNSYSQRASIEEPAYKSRKRKIDESELHNYTKALNNYYNATNEDNAYYIGRKIKKELLDYDNLAETMGLIPKLRRIREIRTGSQYSSSTNSGAYKTNFGARGNGNASVGRKLTDAQR